MQWFPRYSDGHVSKSPKTPQCKKTFYSTRIRWNKRIWIKRGWLVSRGWWTRLRATGHKISPSPPGEKFSQWCRFHKSLHQNFLSWQNENLSAMCFFPWAKVNTTFWQRRRSRIPSLTQNVSQYLFCIDKNIHKTFKAFHSLCLKNCCRYEHTSGMCVFLSALNWLIDRFHGSLQRKSETLLELLRYSWRSKMAVFSFTFLLFRVPIVHLFHQEMI